MFTTFLFIDQNYPTIQYGGDFSKKNFQNIRFLKFKFWNKHYPQQ
jgi:hypothetical protein